MSPKKPKLGQNFLIDPGARLRIVQSLGDISACTVLEIGPGRGALTDLLASRAHRLIAVELDRALGPQLADTWKHAPHVSIHCGDILDLDLGGLHPDGPLVVVGNLPYYITSDILLHLFAHASIIDRAVVMVQNEVADRLAARCGTSTYGVLSATAQMHAQVDKLFPLPPEAFAPPPKVDSAVVRLAMRPRFQELRVERSSFLRFLQICFHQKRKTLVNNLKEFAAPSVLQSTLREIGLDTAIRAEAVCLEAMAQIFRKLQLPT